ncbi:MAG: hypothetical protein KI785_14505 [Devosiaceae bacterium]|nr:hypothetical protein [Devosiaceae bacterium MH13]
MREAITMLLGAALTLAFGAVGALVTPSAAHADSCWDHNGSVMRLSANGQQRWLSYETTPHAWQGRAGVRPGTLLFDGRNTGDYYVGTARVFSRFCPGNPLLYNVEGPVSRPGGQIRITMHGTRDANDQCTPTGNLVTDTLVFTYLREC